MVGCSKFKVQSSKDSGQWSAVGCQLLVVVCLRFRVRCWMLGVRCWTSARRRPHLGSQASRSKSRTKGRFMESPLSIFRMHWDPEPQRRLRRRDSVLECGSPLPLLRPQTRSKSARGLAQSKTWRPWVGSWSAPEPCSSSRRVCAFTIEFQADRAKACSATVPPYNAPQPTWQVDWDEHHGSHRRNIGAHQA